MRSGLDCLRQSMPVCESGKYACAFCADSGVDASCSPPPQTLFRTPVTERCLTLSPKGPEMWKPGIICNRYSPVLHLRLRACNTSHGLFFSAMPLLFQTSSLGVARSDLDVQFHLSALLASSCRIPHPRSPLLGCVRGAALQHDRPRRRAAAVGSQSWLVAPGSKVVPRVLEPKDWPAFLAMLGIRKSFPLQLTRKHHPHVRPQNLIISLVKWREGL